MLSLHYLLLNILMLLGLGAVIAFCHFVLKPFQTHWAIVRARKIVAGNGWTDDWRSRNVYRMLATARNDLEAAKLWHQLDAMRQSEGKRQPS
ncbi:MAG: hypothetical protein PHR43_07180 [Dehalococcoidales bacterium]|nr:hypothetical protein [Dehalococcoidales bacterium]